MLPPPSPLLKETQHIVVHEHKLEIYIILWRYRCPILFVKFTLIHPDDFIKEIPSLIEVIIQK